MAANTILFADTSDVIRNLTIDNTNGLILAFPSLVRRVQISVDGANPLRVYRRKIDFTNNANFITLPASTGFFDGTHQGRGLWMLATGGATTATISVYYADGNVTG